MDSTVDYTMNRVVVKFFWQQMKKPTDPADWAGRDGVIAVIRRRMGSAAPHRATVKLTLERLAIDENDDVSNKMVSAGVGRPRLLSDEDYLYIGLLLCEGHSQRSATFLINGERAAHRSAHARAEQATAC